MAGPDTEATPAPTATGDIGGRHPAGPQVRALARLILAVAGLALLAAAVVYAVGLLADDTDILFLDVYEAAGSRLSGIGSNLGILLWAIAGCVCLFGAWLTVRLDEPRPWGRFLAISGLLALLLLADDYLGIHEAADDVLVPDGGSGSGLLRNASELAVFAAFGLVFLGYLVGYRALIARTEYVLLAVAGLFLAGSLTVDMLPRSVALGIGVPVTLVDAAEDVLKVVGVSFFATYYVRTTAAVLLARLRIPGGTATGAH